VFPQVRVIYELQNENPSKSFIQHLISSAVNLHLYFSIEEGTLQNHCKLDKGPSLIPLKRDGSGAVALKLFYLKFFHTDFER
jgi:hypothetical protein